MVALTTESYICLKIQSILSALKNTESTLKNTDVLCFLFDDVQLSLTQIIHGKDKHAFYC